MGRGGRGDVHEDGVFFFKQGRDGEGVSLWCGGERDVYKGKV